MKRPAVLHTLACLFTAVTVTEILAAAPHFDASTTARLTPSEESIARHPFAPDEVQAEIAGALLLPVRALPKLPPGRGDMGWAQPDRLYWQTIPASAREIPADWSHLPVVRFTNSERGGERQVRLNSTPEYDQWLLVDPSHDLTACISVRKTTHRVYFMEIEKSSGGGWRLREGKDNCYSCHASGPRAIRPLEEAKVDRSTLEQFNRRILSYKVCDFGESINHAARGAALDKTSCVACHNGVERGRLYRIHSGVIRFKTQQDRTMPPDLHMTH
jgi:hypothetical protein